MRDVFLSLLTPRRLLGAALTIVVLVMVGTALAGTDAPEAPAPAPSTTPASTPTSTPTSTPATTATPAPGEAKKAAAAHAGATVKAWARPTLDPAKWRAGVRPLVAPDYYELLRFTDPTNIDATKVTGAPKVEHLDGTEAHVIVKTDTGPMRVVLTGTGNDWRVTSILPDLDEH